VLETVALQMLETTIRWISMSMIARLLRLGSTRTLMGNRRLGQRFAAHEYL
jgi:hypothetical protein